MWAKIQKFGLKHCDVPTMIWNVAFFLRPLVLNIDSRNKKPIPIIFYFLCALFAMVYIYVYVISAYWFVFVRCRQTGELIQAIIIFSYGVGSEMMTAKLLTMYTYINKVQEVVQQILASDAAVEPGSRFANNVMVTLRDVKKRAMVYWIVIVFNGVLYVLKPMLLPGRHLTEDEFVLFGLDPMFETPNYQIAFIISTIAALLTVYIPANITAFFIVATGYVEAQMLALIEQLLCLWEDAEDHYQQTQLALHASNTSTEATRKKIINDFVGERLKFVIKIHVTNMSILNQLKGIFAVSITLEFLLLTVALIAQLLGGLENTYPGMPYGLMAVGMDCFIGQRIIDASDNFEKAVYACKWENFNKSNMKTVQIILHNAQQTMTLSAGSIIVLSFSSFMQVLKSIYSTYTTLRSTME